MLENLVGVVLGERYEIQSLLGQGGMGLVFTAYDRVPGCLVAVKIINPGLPAEVIEKLAQEAHTTASLEHKHILSVYDQGTQLVEGQTLVYLVMELAKGGTLAKRLREKGPLTLYEAERMLRQVCSALDYAHNHRVIHLDLKPDNILYDEHGDALVADFGLAKHFRTAAPETADPNIGGSRHYSPPEQWVMGKHAGRHSDIYALGITLYEALTGERPERQLAKKGFVVQLRQPLPPAIRAVIEQATHIEPTKRYHTARELARAFTAAVGPHLPALSELPSNESPSSRESLVRRILVGLAVLAIAASLILSGRWCLNKQAQDLLKAFALTMTNSSTDTTTPTATLHPSPTPSLTDTPLPTPSPTPTPPPLPPKTPMPTATPNAPVPDTMLPLRNPGFGGIQPNDIPGWSWWAMDNYSSDTPYDPGTSLDTPFFGPSSDPTRQISESTLQIVATAFVKFRVHIFQTTSAYPRVTTRFQALAKAYSNQGGIMVAAGIDPNGGSDCSQARWGDILSIDQSNDTVRLVAPDVVAGPAGRVTVCLYAETIYPAHNNAAFFDDAELIANPE